jgi:hypothetical protein
MKFPWTCLANTNGWGLQQSLAGGQQGKTNQPQIFTPERSGSLGGLLGGLIEAEVSLSFNVAPSKDLISRFP